MPKTAKTKQQVDGLPFLPKSGYGRPLRVKRSRWVVFVARHPSQMSSFGPLCGCGIFGLVKYRHAWERMGSGGPRGPQNRCEACKTSWMCSIHIRSRHTLPALLCSRSCCVPQRRCFVFARVCRAARFIGDGIWLRVPGFEHADGGVLSYDYRKTCQSFLCRPGGRVVLTHGLR